MWTSLIALSVTLVVLVLLKRWLDRRLQGLALLLLGQSELALWLYFALLMPGILLHEISHWLIARLLGARPGRLTIGPVKARGGKLRLGSVSIRETDPLRGSLIGLAPLLAGSLAVLAIANLAFGIALPSGVGSAQERLIQVLGELTTYLRVPDVWLWLYLVFSISNGMLPSETDRRPFASLLLFGGLVTLLLYLTGSVPTVPPEVSVWALQAIEYLVFVFGSTIVVDVIFGAFILVLEVGAEGVTGRRVEY